MRPVRLRFPSARGPNSAAPWNQPTIFPDCNNCKVASSFRSGLMGVASLAIIEYVLDFGAVARRPAVHVSHGGKAWPKGGRHAVAASNPRGVFTQKCVVEDRRGQADGSAAAHSVATENPALAEDGAVLLAGNLLRHLKDHLNQRVLRYLHRPMEKDAGLAEVFDDARPPDSQALCAIASRSLQTQAPGARNMCFLQFRRENLFGGGGGHESPLSLPVGSTAGLMPTGTAETHGDIESCSTAAK